MNSVDPNIFRAYDIRGVDLTEQTAYLIGRGTGTYLIEKYKVRNIAVGRDNRLSGEMLMEALVRGLLETGLDVVDIGLSVSPIVYWATCARDFDAAINITASHNPKEYNGFKIVAKNAHSICGDELQEILKIIEKKDFNIPVHDGDLTSADLKTDYLNDIASRAPSSKKLKLVIDTGNGVTGLFAPKLFKQLGHEVVELYTDLDGNFPNHEANPEELENMKDLISKVKETSSDLGLGFDGDGDRVGVVDEKGNLYSSDFMLLLLVRDLVKQIKKPKIVFDVKTSQVIINEIKKLGAIPVMSRVGHSFIERKMKEIGAKLGGEVSGHMFFEHGWYGFDDALLAAAKICQILSNSQTPLSQAFNDLPKTFTTPEFKAHCPDDKKFAIVKKLVSHFTELYDCLTIDGVRIKFDDATWAAVRASNTTPNLTLRFEADTRQKLADIQSIMVEELKKHPEVSLDWYSPTSS